MKKILVLSSFPAPYRVDVFKGLSKYYKLDVFFAAMSDQDRDNEYFINKDIFPYYVLTTHEDYIVFQKHLRNLQSYTLVLAYDWYLPHALKVEEKCIKYKIPYYINCDGAFLPSPVTLKDRIKALVKKRYISHAKKCLANGQYAAEYFKHYGASEENIVFHNFSSLHECDIEKTVVNEQSKALIRRELGLFESKKTVLSIGQFIPRKGFDILLDVWGQFDYSYQLVIIGGGAEQEKYKEIIRGRKYKNVHLLGYKSRNIISKYYQASDVFVLPTREDIWGLVINEAMAHGLPVISTANCIAACELIQNKINGYVIPGDDPEALSSALTNIWQENLKEIGTNNINKIKTYTIENVINQHLSVFQSDFDF